MRIQLSHSDTTPSPGGGSMPRDPDGTVCGTLPYYPELICEAVARADADGPGQGWVAGLRIQGSDTMLNPSDGHPPEPVLKPRILTAHPEPRRGRPARSERTRPARSGVRWRRRTRADGHLMDSGKLAVVQRDLGSVAQWQEHRHHFGERGFESRQIHQKSVRGRRAPMGHTELCCDRARPHPGSRSPGQTTEIPATHRPTVKGVARQSMLRTTNPRVDNSRGDSWRARSDVESAGRPPRGQRSRRCGAQCKREGQGRWPSPCFSLDPASCIGASASGALRIDGVGSLPTGAAR